MTAYQTPMALVAARYTILEQQASADGVVLVDTDEALERIKEALTEEEAA